MVSVTFAVVLPADTMAGMKVHVASGGQASESVKVSSRGNLLPVAAATCKLYVAVCPAVTDSAPEVLLIEKLKPEPESEVEMNETGRMCKIADLSVPWLAMLKL